MVIQRIQTLWLIVAIALMVAFAIAGINMLASLIINVLIIVLLAASIFMFSNLHRQMLVTRVNMLLTVAAVATYAVLQFKTNACYLNCILPALALVFEYLALRGMRKDHKLLSNTDRIR